jgi:hypothetical protein
MIPSRARVVCRAESARRRRHLLDLVSLNGSAQRNQIETAKVYLPRACRHASSERAISRRRRRPLFDFARLGAHYNLRGGESREVGPEEGAPLAAPAPPWQSSSKHASMGGR